jgi:hypothetical protein
MSLYLLIYKNNIIKEFQENTLNIADFIEI